MERDGISEGYGLILFDLDGTLLTPKRTIHPANLKLLRHLIRRGVLVSFATGRSPRSVSSFCRLLRPNAPLILFNGALVYDPPTGEVVISHHLGLDDALAALAVAEYTGLHINLYIDDEILISRRTPISEASEAKDGVPHKVVGDLIGYLESQESAPTKLLCIGEPELFEPFAEEIQRSTSGGVVVVNSEPDYFEVLPVGVSKGAAARALVEHVGLGLDEVMAFGDNKNDLELLDACGLGVAMGNGEPELRAQADIVIDGNDSDGIAYYLSREFVLQKGRLVPRS